MTVSALSLVHSEIENLWQTSSGPDNYTLSWVVRNTSSISVFRIYHQGALHYTTLLTSHTVASLLPCSQYSARVEALCGDSVVMSSKTVCARTGKLRSPDLEAHVELLRDKCLGSSHVYF